MSDYNYDPAQGGIKKDEGKRLWSLLPEFLLDGVVDVLTLGAQKYTAFNWAKGMPYSRVYNSTRRHLNDWFWRKKDIDGESGLHHLDHAICNLLFLRYYTMRYPDQDDRVDLLPPGARPGASASSDASSNTTPTATPSDPAQTTNRFEAALCGRQTTLSRPGRPSKAEAWKGIDALKPGTVLFQSPSPAAPLSFDEAIARCRELQEGTAE